MISTVDALVIAVAETRKRGYVYRISGGEPWRVVACRGSPWPWYQSPVVAVCDCFFGAGDGRGPLEHGSGTEWCARRMGLPEDQLALLETDQLVRVRIRQACGVL